MYTLMEAGLLKLWSLQRRECVSEFRGHRRGIHGLEVSGQKIARLKSQK